MTQPPLNVDEYENAARECLDPAIYDYLAGGALDEITLTDNRRAYNQWRLRPRVLAGVQERDLSVTVLGDSLRMPVGIAPTAFHKLAHPDGELATVRAAGSAGTVMCLSTMATTSLEDVAAAASGPLWFQSYVFKDRGFSIDLMQRARAAGYRALVLTVDTPVLGRRERDLRNHFTLPPGIEMSNLTLLPSSSGSYQSPMFRFVNEQLDPSLTWRDVEQFVQTVKLPVLVKGILHPQDARLAVEAGAAGIIVSNHGGRQLDGAIATIDALPDIVEAMAGSGVDVIVDGGIRRGTDIVKALALGAKMVLVGRPVLWGLAVDGEAGATAVLNVLRQEFDTALALVGCTRASDLSRDILMRVQSA